MSSKVSEDTVNDLMGQYLRGRGFNVLAQTIVPSQTGFRKPDFCFSEKEGIFYGEGEWENKKWEGLAQANDYSELPDAQGAFLIAYDLNLRSQLMQKRLGKVQPETLLSNVKYSLAFLKPGAKTAIKGNVKLEDVPVWLGAMIQETVPTVQDTDELIKILRQAALALTTELKPTNRTLMLFRNLLSGDPTGKKTQNAAKMAAGYLLLNQIAFYRVLSHSRGYTPLNSDMVKDPSDLQRYFNEVLHDNYYPVFSFGVAEEFGSQSLPIIKNVIKMIYSIAPEHISQGVLGKVFHELIPLEVRKPVAAYYTLEPAADILAEFAVRNDDDKVMDPACGSGTLLAAAYQLKKKKVKGKFTEKVHKKFVERDITGIDIMPFATHLSTIHLALQGPIYNTDRVRIAIHDATTLKPGDKIPSISIVLPRARLQRKMDDFQKPDFSLSEEMIRAGVVSLKGQLKLGELELNDVNVVLMNPPFTRFQRLARFDESYTKTLASQFSEYSEYIDGRMPYAAYFIFLADRFLDKGGRIGAVLPATMLRGDSTTGLRRFLLKNYEIESIIIREDQMNFSEDTNYREILLVARKDSSTKRID